MKKIIIGLICLFIVNLVFQPSVNISKKGMPFQNIFGQFITSANAANDFYEIKKIMPLEYDRIRKIKVNDKIVYVCEKNEFISLYSPDGLYDNFIKKYFIQNNKLQNMHFENYPTDGVIRYKRMDKYGIIYVKENIIHITKPMFEKVEFPDDNSLVGKMLNISFAPLDNIILYVKYPKVKNSDKYLYLNAQTLFFSEDYVLNSGYVYLPPSIIREEINIKDNNLQVIYKNIKDVRNKYAIAYTQDSIQLYDMKNNKLIKYKNLNLKKIQKFPQIDSIESLYNFINTNTNLYLKNYPTKGKIQIGKKLYFFDSNKFDRLNGIYDDFKLYGSGLYLNRLTGLKLCFDEENIIVAKRNDKWGIVDLFGEVRVPFIYDEITPIEIDLHEIISNIDDVNIEQLNLEYVSQSKSKNLFIARNGQKYGIINSQNDILVPLEYQKYSEKNDFDSIKTQIDITMQKEEQRNNRKEMLHSIPWIITAYIIYPLSLLIPIPPVNLNINIDY